MEKIKKMNKFLIDTKGVCFMCLVNNGRNQQSFTYSVELSRFLKVDVNKVFNVSSPLQQCSNVLENTEMLVSLCHRCSQVFHGFEELYRELEEVRLKLVKWMNRVHDLMDTADKDGVSLEKYRQLMMTCNPVELINASIAENLRKETILKCSLRLKTESPQVKLRKLSRDRVSQGPVVVASAMQINQWDKVVGLDVDANTGTENYVGVSDATIVEEEAEIQYYDEGEDDNMHSPEDDPLNVDNHSDGGVVIFEDDQPNSNALMCETILEETTADDRIANLHRAKWLKDRKCPVCGKYIYSSQGFTVHYRVHQTPAEAIPVLSVELDSGSDVEFVVDTSTKGSQLKQKSRPQRGKDANKCTHCRREFATGGALKNHEMQKHRTELFGLLRDSGVPVKKFENALERLFESIKSKKSSAVDASIGCPYCGTWVRSQAQLKRHLYENHFNRLKSKIDEILSESTGKKRRVASPPPTPPSLPSLSNQGLTVFMCTECMDTFDSSPLYKEHMLSTHLDSIFNDCKMKGDSQEAFAAKIDLVLKESMKQLKGVGVCCCACIYCDLRFKTQTDVKFHVIENHRQEVSAKVGLLKNKGVPTSFKLSFSKTNESSLCGIEENIDSRKDNKNDADVKATTSKKSEGKTVQEEFYCGTCKLQFTTSDNYCDHMLSNHRKDLFSKYCPPGASLNEINSCIQQLLLEHMNVEDDGYGCDWCSKTFPEVSTLHNHVLVHHFQNVTSELKDYFQVKSCDDVVVELDEETVASSS